MLNRIQLKKLVTHQPSVNLKASYGPKSTSVKKLARARKKFVAIISYFLK